MGVGGESGSVGANCGKGGNPMIKAFAEDNPGGTLKNSRSAMQLLLQSMLSTNIMR
jgi:hypothetical protein